MFEYTAIVSIGKKEVTRKSGNELDSLYAWMLSVAEGKTGHYKGQIIENKTKQIIKQFRTSSEE